MAEHQFAASKPGTAVRRVGLSGLHCICSSFAIGLDDAADCGIIIIINPIILQITKLLTNSFRNVTMLTCCFIDIMLYL